MDVDMKPLLASLAVAGLPMTSLFSSGPFLGISKSAEPPAEVMSELQSL